MKVQSGRVLTGALPSTPAVKRSLEFVAAKYPTTKVPMAFRGEVLDVTDQDLNDVLKSVKPQSSPGVPWGRLAKTKSELIATASEELKAAIRARLVVLASRDLRGLSARELVQVGAVDPCRTFVKNEPHKLAKLNEGRYRLIASRSIVDECVERMLFSIQNEREIACWRSIPSKPGMGLSLDEQTDAIVAYVEAFPGNYVSNDVSAWDWCIKGWQADFEVDCRLMLNGGFGTVFEVVARNVMYALFMSVFITSDGHLYEQLSPGVMKSGSYLTASTNSRLRAALAVQIGAEFAMTMGDDSVEQDVPGAAAAYEVLGFNVRSESIPNGFSFCSHHFRGGVAEPESVLKSLHRLLSSPYSHELFMAFTDAYRHSPELARSLETMTGSGWLPVNHG